MKRAARLAWALTVVCVVSFGVTLLAQQQPAVAQAVKPKLTEPMRGTAVISVLKPVTKVKGNEVVTVLSVKNSWTGPLPDCESTRTGTTRPGTSSAAIRSA